MSQRIEDLDSLDRYTIASELAADQIIASYSTSFGAATRLLGKQHRTHIRNIYALVRVADELVDGVTDEVGLAKSHQRQLLDALETETHQAMKHGYSSNPIVHAFARTARLSGIDESLTTPFFHSMRIDLEVVVDSEKTSQLRQASLKGFDETAHSDYVFGSAEVIGLMCLKVFLRNEQRTPSELAVLEHGARQLGAAFQNVNFLRDLADDTDRLSRSYLSEEQVVTEDIKNTWISVIREQLSDAEKSIATLPADARVAVDCARRLFASLADKIDATPAAMLYEQRVRVSNFEKVFIILNAKIAIRKREVS